MAHEDRKERLLQYFEDVVNGGRIEELDTYLTHDFRSRGETVGVDGFRAFLTALRSSVPDAHVELEDELIAEGSLVVGLFRVSGTYTADAGKFPGVKPIGQRYEVPMFVRARFDGEKIAEFRSLEDSALLAQQLGVIGPMPWDT